MRLGSAAASGERRNDDRLAGIIADGMTPRQSRGHF